MCAAPGTLLRREGRAASHSGVHRVDAFPLVHARLSSKDAEGRGSRRTYHHPRLAATRAHQKGRDGVKGGSRMMATPRRRGHQCIDAARQRATDTDGTRGCVARRPPTPKDCLTTAEAAANADASPVRIPPPLLARRRLRVIGTIACPTIAPLSARIHTTQSLQHP